MHKYITTVLLFSAMLLAGCSQREVNTDQSNAPVSSTMELQTADVQKAVVVFLPADGPSESQYPELHNLIQVTEKIYSGAEPKTEAAFRQLADLGVKAIVSVDGAKPKVDLASKFGIRYVHIPIGYDGLDTEAVQSFARAADELGDTTYVHCHHGKHRGPAAAAAICIARGNINSDEALKLLEKAGTSRGYAGLWRDVRNYQRPASNEPLPQLVSAKAVGSVAAAMAQIDRASDNLKLCNNTDWNAPVNHPDISPTQEALLLKEGFHELNRQLVLNNDRDETFYLWMKESEDSARLLEEALSKRDLSHVVEIFGTLQLQCTKCHESYRN